jgi:hypothetical protein
MFKAGDTIKCVRDWDAGFTAGKIYIVAMEQSRLLNWGFNPNEVLVAISDYGVANVAPNHCFVSVDKPEPKAEIDYLEITRTIVGG